MKRILTTTFFLLAFTMGVAQGAEKTIKQSLFGTIQSLKHINSTLVIDGKQFELDSETLVVTVQGTESDIEEISVGDQVWIEYEIRTGPERLVITSVRK